MIPKANARIHSSTINNNYTFDMNRSAMLPTSEFTFPGSLGLDDFLKMQSGDDMTESQALLASLLDTPPLELPDETKRKVSTDYDEIAVQNPSKFTHGNAVDNVEHDQDDMDGEQDHPQKKKPGRKPLTTAPNSKRKAQNRAAQRAFRERKERYVKDLEDKVSQLENESTHVSKENQLLRSMIDKLKSENSLLKSSNFTFDFPISAAHELPATNKPVTIGKPPSIYTPPSSDAYEDQSSGASSANSPSSQMQAGSSIESPLSSFGASPQSTTESLSASDEQPPSTCSAQDLLSEPVFDASGALGKSSSLCQSDGQGTSIGSVTTTTAPHLQGQLFSNYRDTSSGVFDDGFDLQPLPMTSLFGDQTADVGDLLMSPGGGSGSLQMPNLTSTPQAESKGNPLSQESVAQLVSCPKLWEKISTHPNFDDLDIDNLCSELKKKAKCSGHGPVVKEDDVNAVLRNAGINF